jgi:midasin
VKQQQQTAQRYVLLQDYMGSYLPVGNGQFQFNEGPLLRAVRLGEWLLIDELNLAEPAVLSALCPLLEGATTFAVPGRRTYWSRAC